MIFKKKNPKQNKANICMDCKKACGGCSWSRWDEKNKRVAFEPVPGWTAEKVPYKSEPGRHSRNRYGVELDYTYKITACPEFEGG